MLDRLKLLIDEKTINELININVLIVGVGGVGGSCFEALVRLGVKNITVIDNDTFNESNLNRQILSNLNNIGNNKAKEAQIRAKCINEDTNIKTLEMFLDVSNIDQIDLNKYDYILDCCDTVNTKILLIEKSLEYNKKIICATGSGNRLDPTKLEITNIWKTNNDPLAKVLRKKLREKNIKAKIPVVASKEIPIKTNTTTIGSSSLVPNVAGFYMASYVLNDIINKGK